MKLAMIVPGGVDRSGERRVIPALLALIERLAAHHDLHVFALYQEPRADHWQLAGARIHNVGAGHGVVRAVAAIRREHGRGSFDLVHSIWSGACGLAGVASARLLGLPNIVHLAGGELVSLRGARYGGQRHLRWRLLERCTLRLSSRVTAASAPLIADAARLGVSALRIPLGVDLRVWTPREPAARSPHEALRLVHVASLNRVKDQETLLVALRLLRELGVAFEMDVIGEDTLDGAVQRQARMLGLAQQVRFHGFLTQRQLLPLVVRAHVNVISSLHEAGPLVLLECAACGVPTVGTAVGHMREWAPAAALAVPVGDAGALARSLARLGADETLRQRIGRAALERARVEDADHTAAAFEALYRSLLTRSSR
jgi:glycosyltransferase involved in cell wall biosynthesis